MRVTIIGGGPAGIYAALELSDKAKVTLIEKEDKLGGTCVLYGCIPTKSMINPLIFSKFIEKLGNKRVNYDFTELRSLANESLSRISKGIEYTLINNGVEIIHGEGELKGGRVRVRNSEIISDYIIIATGTYREKIEGILYTEDLAYLNNDYKKIIILGGDVGGIELSWLMRVLGKEVILIDKQDSLLHYLDRELREAVTNILKRLGVKIYLGKEVIKINKNKLVLNSNEEIEGDAIFVTFGRRPNLKGFEEVSHNKYILVNEFLQTNMHNIFAAGDVIGTHTAHEAIYAGIIASKNILGQRLSFQKDAIPKVIYMHPQVAYVGSTNEGKCVKIQLAGLTRAIIDRSTEGFFKLCVRDSRIIGAIALMPNAEEVITLVSILMKLNVPLDNLINFILPHPSYLEVITEALLELKI
jgi:dihydrolipoamide dehydrogenase